MESNRLASTNPPVCGDRMPSRLHRNLPQTQESTTPYPGGVSGERLWRNCALKAGNYLQNVQRDFWRGNDWDLRGGRMP